MNKTIQILIIEDDAAIADYLQEILAGIAEPQFSCSLAQKLSQGLTLLREKHFNMVLLDLGLPDSQGLDTALTVRKEFPRMPIVVLTGLTDQEIAIKSLQLDIQDFLVKGQMNGEVLARSIRYAIERKRSVDALRESEALSRATLAELQTVYATAPVGLCLTDTGHRLIRINKRLAEINGQPPEKIIGRTFREVIPELAETIERLCDHVITTGEPVENVEMHAKMRSGDFERYFLGSYYPITDDKGRIFGVNTVMQEITERKKMEEDIRHMAHHDVLTDLPNRRLFMDIVNIEAAQARRNRTKLAVLFLDLDRFKDVNDRLGHTAGDELLKEVAKRLKASIRESDTVARIGGDEFNIVLSDIVRTERITAIVQKILDSFRKPCIAAGHQIPTTSSIGISVYPDDSQDIDTLFRFADIAMYHAKEAGRNRYRFYNPEINVRSIERAKMENHLRRTIDRGELTVHYQPQFDIKTKKMVCAEALVRWNHPDMGLLEPNSFIPLAEETGFIGDIDEWVLRTVCGQIRSWLDAGAPPPCVTVNLSMRQFQSPELAETITRILEETAMPPEYLDVEITESTAMNDIKSTVERSRELVDMGIHISIDDFGTGYSSLNYLKRLPLQRLKIDRSFVRDIASDPDDRALINAVTAMAHSMKMKVVAEGVETEEQLSFVSQSHCDEVQGYLLNEPVPPEKLTELMAVGK